MLVAVKIKIIIADGEVLVHMFRIIIWHSWKKSTGKTKENLGCRAITSFINVLLKEAKGHCRRFFFRAAFSTRE
jgi:hypothetical protein